MVDAPLPLTTMSSTNSTETPTATTTTTSSSSVPAKKPSAVRLPSLNQLAARITSNAAAANGGAPIQPSTSSAARPRLAASVLRTVAGSGSTTSVNTVTSNADSMAVNVPSTRSTSPAISNASTTTSNAQGDSVSGGEPLTEEKLEKLNQETASADGTVKFAVAAAPVATEAPRRKVGYKNIPSLEAITSHLAKARASQLSVDGSTMPPEPEMIEDPKTPGVPMKAPEHPLQFPWYRYSLNTSLSY